MPAAEVALTNVGTSERRTAETDNAGNYQFVSLVPGRYRVDIQRTGFKHLTRDEIVVEVAAAVRIDATMQVGDVAQTIEVQAQTPLLQTETSSLSEVVEGRKVQEMPLNGRNVFNLITLVPGVLPQGQSMTNPSGQNIFSFGNFQVGGSVQAGQSAAYLDGAPLNSAHGNVFVLVPSQDAMQEFRVQTNNLSPEFGRFSGGVINLTSKSGTNDFHGGAFEFLRNKVLNANTFFNNRSGIQRPPFTQNQFGANIGGPIFKDKTFFFFGYDGFRLRQGQAFLTTVPTDAMRAGDFSNLRRADGTQVPIYDALSTCGVLGNAACTGGATTRQPFLNNVVPVSRIDPAARILTKEWARANLPGQQFTFVNNFAANASVGGNNDQYNARIDHGLSEKQRIFGRFTYWTNFSLPGPDPFQSQTYIDRGPEHWQTHSFVFADTYTFSPTTVGDLRLSWSRFAYDRVPGSTGVDLSTIGFPAAENTQVTFATLPELRVPGYVDIYTSYGVGSVIFEHNDTYSVAPSLTKIAGAHTFKFGGEIRRQTDNYIQVQPGGGSFSFSNVLTSVNPFAPGNTGNAFASYMLGYGSSGSIPVLSPYAARNYFAGLYFNDAYQVTNKLTLNLGLRWEMPFPFSERYDRYVVFLPGEDSPLAKPTGLPVKGRLGLVNSSDNPSRAGGETHWRLFAPRVGFAYRVTNKTVVRSGYGISYEITDGGGGSALTSISTNWVPTLDGGVTPSATLSNPFPGGILQPPQRDPSYQTVVLGSSITAPVPNFQRFAYIQQWNFGVQRELPDGTTVEVSYAGAKGTHIGSVVLNQLPDQFLSLGTRLQQQVTNPFYGLIPSSGGTLANPTVAYGQLLRPYPQYTGVTMSLNGNRDSVYHSMQVKVEKRFRGAGSVLGAYTYSKLISDIEASRGWLEAPGGIAAIQNNNNLAGERSVSSFDVPHRLVVSYVLDLPIGKGQKFWTGVNGVPGRMLSGWGVNGVSTFQSGYPLGITTATNLTNSFGGGSRPNYVSGCTASISGSAQSKINGWFNTACFTAPPSFTFGNTGRTLSNLRGPGVNNWDFALFKNTALTERVRLQFRTEFFNLFNRVQFQIPITTVGVPQFGVISLQANNPRLIQMALRLQY